jgi:beta-N-acetylglucosaminidase
LKKLGKALLLTASILSGATVISTLPLGIEKTMASSTIKMKKTSFQTTSNLYLRTGAGTKFKKVLTIPKGRIVTVTEKISSWAKLSYTYKSKGKSVTKTGWASSTYLKENYQYSSMSKTYYFSKRTVKLYSTPDTKKKAAYTIASNNGFTSNQKVVNSIGQTWYRITYNGKGMYVNSDDVIKNSFSSIAPTNYQAKKDTYVYQLYGNTYKKLTKVPKGAIVSSTKKIGDWYSVTYNGVSGYFFIGDVSKYVGLTYQYTDTNATYYFTKASAKLYSTPDNLNKEACSIASNNGFTSTQKVMNSLGQTWYRVSFEGKTLYINSNDVTSKSLTSFTQTRFKANKDTYVYQSFGNVYGELASIPKDTIVTSSSSIGDWYNVTYNGVSGYFYAGDFSTYSDVTETKITDTTFVTIGDLNLRTIPDPSSTIVTTIPNAKIVIATYKVSNGWYKVKYGNIMGYVSGSYIQQVKTGDPLTNRYSYQFVDLRSKSPVTAKQINDYIANYVKTKGKISVLTGKGQTFIDAGNKYGVNALYLAAHAIHESAYGTSTISLGKYNLFGFGAYDASPFIASYRFSSVDLCIDYIAREIKSTYLNPNNWKYNGAYLGFSTKDMNNKRLDTNSEGMNFYYASDPNWGMAIAQHMENILPYEKSYYSKATVNTVVPAQPSKPIGSDLFPNNVLAIAKKDLVLNTNKGTNDAVNTLKKGSTFAILEKTNDYWVKVMVDNKIYWTSDIKFDAYKTYLSVKNLGRTTASLNVRKDPTVSDTNIISVLDPNDYVSIILSAGGTLTMDSSKSWYNVQLADGKVGWVSAQYIVSELK